MEIDEISITISDFFSTIMQSVPISILAIVVYRLNVIALRKRVKIKSKIISLFMIPRIDRRM